MDLDVLRVPTARRSRTRGRFLTAVLLASVPGWGAAQEWEVTPSVSASFVYNSNINFSASDPESDFSLVLTPEISVTRNADRSKLVLSYRADIARSLTDTASDIDHQFLGIATVEVVENRFFVDARGLIDQYIDDAIGPDSGPLLVTAQNAPVVGAFSVTPTARAQFARFAGAEASYRFGVVQGWNDNDRLSDSTAHEVTLRLVSGPTFSRLKWSTTGSAERVLYSDGRDGTTSYNAGAEASYAVTEEIAAIAGGGWERVEDPTFREPKGGFYGYGGADWHPSPRTNVRAVAGQRYGQLWFDVDGRYDVTERTRFTASYKESVETVQTLALEELGDILILDPSGNPLPPEVIREILIRSGLFQVENEAFLSSRASVGVTSRAGRTEYGSTLFWEGREYDTARSDSSAWGAKGFIRQELAPQTAATFSVNYRVSEGDDSGQRWGGSLTVTHQFNETLSGSVTLGHERSYPDAGGDASQNRIAVTLRKVF